MPRFNACRCLFYVVLALIVVVVQISLNLLLLYCGESSQNVHESKREITKDIVSRLYSERLRTTTRTTAASKVQLKHATTTQNFTEIEELRKENAQLASKLARYEKLKKIISAQEFSKLKSHISKLDFLKDETADNEFTVVPFDSFTDAGIFSVNKDGLVDRPARRPIGARLREQEEILNFALSVLQDQSPGGQKIERYNIANGISRLDRLTGMRYDLIFGGSERGQYHRVKISRPFSNIELVDSVETLDTSKELINLIIPLSGRIEHFTVFLKRFGEICVRWDGRVHLTVIYFGKKGREKVQNLLSEFEETEKFRNYKLILEDEPFSRGVGLQRGVLSWEKGNNIMFFCDVDMYFTAEFLERCRFYTEPGRMVFYPIVFSLYNPDIVYNGKPPSINQQLYIGKDNGFWRDFGFGMTCVYKNDFVETGGFDTSIHGWGTEDIKLYKKFLETNLAVIRATDRGIFHMYHPKNCDSALPSEQYISCLYSKAVTEASHRQMGLLAFGNRLFSNFEPDWKTKLEYQPDFSLRDSKTKNKEAVNLWRRADELNIEILEIKQLRKRLKAAMNFTVFGQGVFDSKKFNMSFLRELELGLQNVTGIVKKLALAIGKNDTNHG